MRKPKQTIYWDVDDVAINSVEVTVNLINKLYNIPNNLPLKTTYDVKDWKMTSIYRGITQEQLEQIFKSDDFWNEISLKRDFRKILNSKCFNSYNHIFITKGSEENLTKKKEFLSNALGNKAYDFRFIGLLHHESKASEDMTNAIFIDDNMKNLIESNAAIKILITNGLETCYNNAYGEYNNQLPDNLYIVSDLNEVLQILEFNSKHNLLTLD